MQIKVYFLNSFTDIENGGNKAGVVIDKYGLNNITMQKIASIVGLSETAFVKVGEEADFNLRFFTPNSEVDLCGHATIATFALLRKLNTIKEGKYTQKTNAGLLKIDVSADGYIYMTQSLPEFGDFVHNSEIQSCFNIAEDIVERDLTAQIVSTGLRDILVPIKDLRTLRNLKPDFQKIKELSKKYNVIGMHAFTLETLDDSIAHCRNFAPLYGIDEESATGTSNGALGCYLYKNNKLNTTDLEKIKIEQGHLLKQPSIIMVRLKVENNIINEVKVGGKAAYIQEINLDI